MCIPHCLPMALLLLLQLCPPCHCSTATPLEHKPLFSFSSTWEVLGPFQIGTREATWGADPLELHGGFRKLDYDPHASFRSSLTANGTAHWNITNVESFGSPVSANASLTVGYSNVDWDLLRTIYGWAAVQYQAWARGELFIGGDETQHVVLHTDAILEYWIDDVPYFGGDFYSYRNAPPVLHLRPGHHRIDVRLARDVRAFGGILEPTIDVVIGVEQVSGTLELAKPGILMSDVIDGRLATPQGSLYLRNSGTRDIEVTGIHAADVSANVSTLFAVSKMDANSQMLLAKDDEHRAPEQVVESKTRGIIIVPGQTRPVRFNITLPSHNASSIAYNITYKVVDSSMPLNLEVTQDLNHLSTYDTHKITFMHPSGTVSYAMLRSPAKNATCNHEQTKLPVLLALHGAGLEADDPMVTAALDPISDICAWTIFPTGVTPWSGDDWHNWGFADVEAVIEAIPAWIQHGNWSGPDVDIERWIVSGHSNGGQGAWYAITHRPDKVLAAIPVAGYSSIQKYVPYELWQPADPRRTSVISASLNDFRHEMLMHNAQGIPIQQQHGDVDDNVPAYHSRLLAQLLQLAGANSSYNEVLNKNHWWDYIMTTPELVAFYHSQAKNEEELPREIDDFSIVVGDPGSMGSKGGVKVTQLEDPGQYGRVHVKGRTVKTSNVLSIEFGPPFWKDAIMIDGQTIELATDRMMPVELRMYGSSWSLDTANMNAGPSSRRGRQLGSMAALLRTRGPIIVQHSGSANTSRLALQVSRNLHQYFRADTIILEKEIKDSLARVTGNIVELSIGDAITGASKDFPIQTTQSSIILRDHRGREQQYDQARGAAWLQPLEDERVKLVLWGADDAGLTQATRLVPLLTGVGQPDFIVLSEDAKWKGIEGALALGFFDAQWQITSSSVLS